MTDLINSLEALAGKVTPGDWSHVRNPENTRWIIDSKPDHAIRLHPEIFYNPENPHD